MTANYRDQRKAEILALSQKAVKSRGTRRRNLQRVAGASAAMLILTAGFFLSRLFVSAPRAADSLVAHVSPPVALPEPMATPDHLIVESTEPSWVVHSRPIREDQIITTRSIASDSIASDSDLMQCLIDTDVPGLVRVKGRVYAAFELLPPAPIDQPVPAGSGPVPIDPDSPKATLFAAL